jgi:hypothetical protein
VSIEGFNSVQHRFIALNAYGAANNRSYDNDDVSPVKGVIVGGHRHSMYFGVDVQPVDETPGEEGSDNGDGEINGDDIAWISDNNDFRVQNLPSFDGAKPRRDYHGLQLVFNKRYSDRWQALGSFLYSKSYGVARRTIRQDTNILGPMFWDDNWMNTLNDTINNMDGPLPFTPKYEVKVSGSYKIPRVEVDFGARFRMATGKPMWQLENYPQHNQSSDPPGGIIDGGSRIVGNQTPTYLPAQHLLDLHLEKAFKAGGGARRVHLIVDGFNIFNSSTPNDINISESGFGKVTSIPTSRRFRGGVRFEF